MFKQTNTQGVFGAPSNTNQGIFGGAVKTNPTAGFGVSAFGNNQQPSAGGVFGNQQQNAGFLNNNAQQAQGNGQQGIGQPGMFMQQGNQPSLFAGSQPNNTVGLFGNQAGQQQQPQNVLGAPQAQNQGNPFGSPQVNPSNNGLFGAQQPSNNGMFGNSQANNPMNANNGQTNGLFGQGNQPTNGLFGQNTQQNPQQTTGMFGGASQQNQNRPNGLFGGAQQTTGTTLFGNQQPQTQQANPFGGAMTTNTSPFGAPQQQQQQQQAGMYGPFGANTQQQQQQPNNSLFGQTGTNSLFGPTNNNAKLGGTDWGVPTTMPATNCFGNTANLPFQPVKTKNAKLDGKHSVKCIAALDQFTGLSKEEVRVSFIQSGGQQPAFQQQQVQQTQQGNGFATGNTLPQTNFFGQNQQNTGLIGNNKPMTPATSLFGQTGQQTQSLFGTIAQQPMQGLFGQNQQQQQQPQQQAPTSLFGINQPAQPQNFGAQTAPTSLFGGQPTTSLFQTNQNQQQQGANTFFGNQPQANPAQQTTPFNNAGQTQSLFTTQPQAQPSFFTQPQQQNAMAQLSSPLFQTPQMQTMDPSLQILLPQLLLSYAMNQPTSAPSNFDPSNNPTMDILSKLTTLVQQMNPTQNQQASPAYASTPFDDFMKEARGDYSSVKPKETEHNYSLFSDFEKEPNYYLESSFTSQYSKRNEEPYYIQSVHKPPKREEVVETQEVYRQVSKKYKNTQEEGKSRLNSVINDLPKIGKFNTFPSIDRLKKYTSEELREVRHFKVWNQYGEIEFCEPVSLIKLDLESVFIISQDNIEITNSELEEKRFRMTFRNFGNYSNLRDGEREKVMKKMRVWIEKCDMKEIRHDDHNGDLVVEVGN